MHLVDGSGVLPHHRITHTTQHRKRLLRFRLRGHNHIAGRDAASQIASASTESFLFDLTNGLTNCGEISLIVCLIAARLRGHMMRTGAGFHGDGTGMERREEFD
jgi:hypothetical protein